MKKFERKRYLQEAQNKVDIDEIIESFFSYVIEDLREMDIEYLFSTFHNFMSHLQLYKIVRKDNNSYIRRNFYEKNNPLIIRKGQIEEWYKNRNEMSKEEKLCYIMLWANRLSKVAEQAIESYIKDKKQNPNSNEYMEALQRIYKDVRGKKFFFEFLRKCDEKNMEILSEGEFQEEKSVRKVKKSISESEISGCRIDLDDVFKYFILQEVKEKMYSIKNKGIKILMQECKNVSFLSDDKETKKIIPLSISIPKYSMPFNFHFYRRYVNELADQYGVNIRIGELQRFPTIWPMRLTDEQIKEIEGFSRMSPNGEQIRIYIKGNRGEKQKIRKYSKTSNTYSAKTEKDIVFATEVAELSGIKLTKEHLEQLANNSQTTLLRTRYKTMQQYFIKQWQEEEKEFSQEELDKEVAKAFVYVKLVRGGLQHLGKNMPSIYQNYQIGFTYIKEAIQQGNSDIKGYTRTKMRKRKINNINGIITKIDEVKQEIGARRTRAKVRQKNGEQK